MGIGYVGLGNMGGALAGRLQLAHDLVVYDLSPAPVARLVERGASASESLADLATRCDVILLCLPTSDDVRTAIFGERGLLHGARPGTMIIDQTSGDPRATRAMANDLDGTGVELIDAPVSGGPKRANDGTIAIMVGAAEPQYARALPILSAISPQVFHAGGVGHGHLIKLVNNLLSGVTRWLTLEGIALAAKQGIQPSKAVEIILASGGRNEYMNKVMGPEILNGHLGLGFSLGLAHKDLRLACQLGEESGVPMFLGNLTRELYQMCINEQGFNTKVDSAALVMDRLAGTHVVPSDYTYGDADAQREPAGSDATSLQQSPPP
jgi:3-hydroxyisobutyrate dehydrogenase